MTKAERSNRLRLAAALADDSAGISLTELARRLGIVRQSLNYWMANGDPDPNRDDHQTLASRAKLAKAGKVPLTGARIAEVLGCPPEALEPGGPLPVWGDAVGSGAEAFALVVRALGLPADATANDALDAVNDLASKALDGRDSEQGAELVHALLQANKDQDNDAVQSALRKLARWAGGGS